MEIIAAISENIDTVSAHFATFDEFLNSSICVSRYIASSDLCAAFRSSFACSFDILIFTPPFPA